LAIIFAMARCCFGLQCISRERMTGHGEVTKAHSAIAFATASNFSTVQRVPPCVTIGFSGGPSQQSISTCRQPCSSCRRYASAELRPVSWSPTMYEL